MPYIHFTMFFSQYNIYSVLFSATALHFAFIILKNSPFRHFLKNRPPCWIYAAIFHCQMLKFLELGKRTATKE